MAYPMVPGFSIPTAAVSTEGGGNRKEIRPSPVLAAFSSTSPPVHSCGGADPQISTGKPPTGLFQSFVVGAKNIITRHKDKPTAGVSTPVPITDGSAPARRGSEVSTFNPTLDNTSRKSSASQVSQLLEPAPETPDAPDFPPEPRPGGGAVEQSEVIGRVEKRLRSFDSFLREKDPDLDDCPRATPTSIVSKDGLTRHTDVIEYGTRATGGGVGLDSSAALSDFLGVISFFAGLPSTVVDLNDASRGEKAITKAKEDYKAAKDDLASYSSKCNGIIAEIEDTNNPLSQEEIAEKLEYVKQCIEDIKKTVTSLSELTATYGDKMKLTSELKTTFENLKMMAAINTSVYLAAVGRGISVSVVALGKNSLAASATATGIAAAGGVVGIVAGVAAAGGVIKEGLSAHKNFNTSRAASELASKHSEDKELLNIAETLGRKQSRIGRTKVGHAILQSLQAIGFTFSGISSFLTLTTGGLVLTGGGIGAILLGGSVALSPLGLLMVGVACTGLSFYALGRLIRATVHHKHSKELEKVIKGNEVAIAKYRERNKFEALPDKNLQQHAADALTKLSGKYALKRLYERLVNEVNNPSKVTGPQAFNAGAVTSVDKMPAVEFLNTFYDDKNQVLSLVKIDSEKALKLLSEKFQIRTLWVPELFKRKDIDNKV